MLKAVKLRLSPGRPTSPTHRRTFKESLDLSLFESKKFGCSLLLPRIPRGCEAEFHGHLHQLGERVGLHLLHHLASVCLHRDLTDPEPESDLFIEQARND